MYFSYLGHMKMHGPSSYHSLNSLVYLYLCVGADMTSGYQHLSPIIAEEDNSKF